MKSSQTYREEDCTKYKNALKETTNEIRKYRLNFGRKLAANIKQDIKRFIEVIKRSKHGRPA